MLKAVGHNLIASLRRFWPVLVFFFLVEFPERLFEHRILSWIDGFIDRHMEGTMKFIEPVFFYLIHTPFGLVAAAIFVILIHAYWEYLCGHHASRVMASISGVLAENHPPMESKPSPSSIRLSHNVQFSGFKIIQITPDLPELALAALCFENTLIPEEAIADFHFARLQVHYSDPATGDVIAKAFLARWHDSPDAPIDILGGERKCAIIASCIGSKWATDSLIDAPINPALEYGFGGSEYKHASVPLPLGRIKVKATLIGTHNLSIPPVDGILTLGKNGSASFVQDAL